MRTSTRKVVRLGRRQEANKDKEKQNWPELSVASEWLVYGCGRNKQQT